MIEKSRREMQMQCISGGILCLAEYCLPDCLQQDGKDVEQAEIFQRF